jgi:hypothetical protein
LPVRQKGAKGAEITRRGVGRTHDAAKSIRKRFGSSWEDLGEVTERAISALTADQAKRTLDKIFEILIVAMAHDDDARIRGFGRFYVQHK